MNDKPSVGLGVIILNNDQKILLGKRVNSHGEFTWGPPGGHLEFGESFEDCAIREVFEETGLTICKPHFLAITNDIFLKESKHYISIFMKAYYMQGQKINNCEPHKTIEWEWFNIDLLPSPLFLSLQQLISSKYYGKKVDLTK